MPPQNRLPRELKDVFNAIKALLPENTVMIIAGGAIRDALNGKFIKDVDIFIDKSNRPHLGERWEKMGKQSPQPVTAQSATPVKPSPGVSGGGMSYSTNSTAIPSLPVVAHQATARVDYSNSSNSIESVYENDWSYAFPVQLVFTNGDPINHVQNYFDFGICKAWYDGTRINCHKDYHRDINNKTITFVMDEHRVNEAYSNPEAAKAQILAHGQRIATKYKGFRLQNI